MKEEKINKWGKVLLSAINRDRTNRTNRSNKGASGRKDVYNDENLKNGFSAIRKKEHRQKEPTRGTKKNDPNNTNLI